RRVIDKDDLLIADAAGFGIELPAAGGLLSGDFSERDQGLGSAVLPRGLSGKIKLRDTRCFRQRLESEFRIGGPQAGLGLGDCGASKKHNKGDENAEPDFIGHAGGSRGMAEPDVQQLIRLRPGLEEEAGADLHDALRKVARVTAFTQHAAKRRRRWIVVNPVEVGVVEYVLGLETNLEILRAFRGDGEFLQQRCIGEERSGIAYVREHERGVAEGERRRLNERRGVQNWSRTAAQERARVGIYQRRGVIARLFHLLAGRKAISKSSPRSSDPARNVWHEHWYAFRIPTCHTSYVPPANDLFQDFGAQAVTPVHELTSAAEGQFVG